MLVDVVVPSFLTFRSNSAIFVIAGVADLIACRKPINERR